MGINENRIPEIRFPGFTGAWEQHKLSALSENITVGIANSATHAYRESGVVMFRNQNIKENHLDDSDVIFIDEEFEKKYINKRLKANDLLIARTGYPGTACVVPEKYEGSQTFTTLIARLKKGINPYYACQYINSDYGKKYISATQIGGGQKNSGAGILEDLPVMLPPTLKEQDIIAGFLTKLDDTITLHQHKCDEVKTLKFAMLQKMFPKNGSAVPEIRFPGFSGDWEQRKLGSVLSFLKDGTHGTHMDSKDGPLLLSAKNIKNGSVNWDETDRRIEQSEYERIHSSFNLKSGDVLLTIVGSIGETAILKDPTGITFQRSVAFLRPDEFIKSEFLYSEIQTTRFQKELENRKSTSAQPGIYLGDLAEIPVSYPKNVNEQIAIGQLFENIDNTITLHQNKCDELKELKKAMLQKMFV